MAHAAKRSSKAWNHASGLAEVPENTQRGLQAREAYAKRLAGYITDPSTVRLRVWQKYGYPLPEIEQIKKWCHKAKRPAVRLVEDDGINIPVIEQSAEANGIVLTESAGQIIQKVADLYGITYGELVGRSTLKKYVRPRQMACVMLYAKYGSYSRISKHMGGRDHSSLINAIKTFFNKEMEKVETLVIWRDNAPPEINHVRTLAEFLRTV